MNTKIKVLKAGYFAGIPHGEGSEIELTERQLACAKRRGREFEVIENFSDDGGPKTEAPKEFDPENPEQVGVTGEKMQEEKSGFVSVKELKATLDDAGIDYPATAKKAELQKLVDEIHDAEGLM